jgi:hypothetical protein
MFLAAVPAKEGRVQPSIRILRVKTLAVERDPPLPRTPQRCIDMTRAGDEAVELEGKKRPFAGAASLARRAAHHHQHRLKLGLTTLLTAVGLSSQALCGFGKGCRRAASKLLTVLEPGSPPYFFPRLARARANNRQFSSVFRESLQERIRRLHNP